ncbi:MAG: cytochrome oxidase putative small subunit CydP [Steroidobacterales bacterium]
MTSRIPSPWKAPDTAHPGTDVLVAIAIKGVLLLAIYCLFFGPAHRPPSDAASTAAALTGVRTSREAP